jgi:hypothetical protein
MVYKHCQCLALAHCDPGRGGPRVSKCVMSDALRYGLVP